MGGPVSHRRPGDGDEPDTRSGEQEGAWAGPSTSETRDDMVVLPPVDPEEFDAESTIASSRHPLLGPAERSAFLVVIRGPDEGLVVKLPRDEEVIIGRLDGVKLCLSDENVSRRHVRISYRDGQYFAEDLGSRNGTFLGDVPVRLHALKGEDLVWVGPSTVVKFSYMNALEEEHLLRMMAAVLRDPLTGVHNRRSFDERLSSECAASRRHKRPLSLMLADIDDFKKINDRLGHLTGDRVLRRVAETLRRNVRQEDTVFRYGGEEFAVLARETPLDGAVMLAERLRKAVSVMDAGGVTATVSIGVAELDGGQPNEGLIACADRRLYLAKQHGKNRVVALDAPPTEGKKIAG